MSRYQQTALTIRHTHKPSQTLLLLTVTRQLLRNKALQFRKETAHAPNIVKDNKIKFLTYQYKTTFVDYLTKFNPRIMLFSRAFYSTGAFAHTVAIDFARESSLGCVCEYKFCANGTLHLFLQTG